MVFQVTLSLAAEVEDEVAAVSAGRHVADAGTRRERQALGVRVRTPERDEGERDLRAPGVVQHATIRNEREMAAKAQADHRLLCRNCSRIP